MKRHLLSATVALSLLGTFAQACKPKTSSHVSNLGIIAKNGNAFRDNWKKGGCGAPASAPETDSNAALMRAFSALPQVFQFVFKPQDFKLESAQNVVNACTADLKTNAQRYPGVNPEALKQASASLTGCWVATSAQGPNGKPTLRPIFYLVNSPEFIHDNMGALAAYAFFEFYVDNILKGAKQSVANIEVQDVLPAFQAAADARAVLTESLISELSATQQGKTSLNIYKGTVLPVSQASGSYETLAQNIVFQNFVIAEMMDSYYCNPKTWESFGTEGLTQTRQRFDAYAKSHFGMPWFAQ
jgi:hypothetical protein